MLRHLIRLGRHWLNPRFLVRIEDLSRPRVAAGDEEFLVVMARGESLSIGGDDAAELRRLLEDDDGDGGEEPAPAGPMPPDAAPEDVIESGYGPGVLVRPASDPARRRRVPE